MYVYIQSKIQAPDMVLIGDTPGVPAIIVRALKLANPLMSEGREIADLE